MACPKTVNTTCKKNGEQVTKKPKTAKDYAKLTENIVSCCITK